jgi:NAD(P)-dependent dehydrogenase (short-subunit alcohol dehydrogenase family)
MTERHVELMRLDGRVAVITGGARGIGAETARVFREAGATVVTWDVSDGADQQVDVTNAKAVEAAVAATVAKLGGIDILVNNAGILRDKMSFNMTEEEWDAVVKVHLKGHFAPARFAGAYWRQKSKDTGQPVNAKIVNTASESGLYGNAGQTNYAAAKAGIAALTIVLARELDRFGVRVNCIAPVALTRLTEDMMGGDEGRAEKLAPTNIAAGVAWLASDLSDGVNGQVLKIQGGMAQIVQGWRPVSQVESDKPWTIESIAEQRDALFANSNSGIPPFFLNINDPTG